MTVILKITLLMQTRRQKNKLDELEALIRLCETKSENIKDGISEALNDSLKKQESIIKSFKEANDRLIENEIKDEKAPDSKTPSNLTSKNVTLNDQTNEQNNQSEQSNNFNN